MRLSDVKIVERLIDDNPSARIVITPMINAAEQIGPASVDVHLGTHFMVVEHSDRLNFDPLMSQAEYGEWLRHLRLVSRYSVLEKFILHPFQFALGRTLEFISLPRDIVGRIDGRSSWARQGLVVHSTAGDIHPGTRGFVVFELMNYGPVPIMLYPGLAIAQLTFETVADVRESYKDRTSSKYSGFRSSLWSGYPDDSILRAMRSLRSGLSGSQRQSTESREDEFIPEHRLFPPAILDSIHYRTEPIDSHSLAHPTASDSLGTDDEFARAFEYFQAHHAELLAVFAGKYVAILEEDVIDFDDDWKQLSERTYRTHGNRPLFMSFVSPEIPKPKYLGGPRGPKDEG